MKLNKAYKTNQDEIFNENLPMQRPVESAYANTKFIVSQVVRGLVFGVWRIGYIKNIHINPNNGKVMYYFLTQDNTSGSWLEEKFLCEKEFKSAF